MASGPSSFVVWPSAGELADFAGRAADARRPAPGAFIGNERQWRQGMAALRTNALVALVAGLLLLEPEGDPGDGHLAVPAERVGEDDAALVL